MKIASLVGGIAVAGAVFGCGTEADTGADIALVEAGDEGCVTGGFRVTEGAETRVVCNDAGAAGASGADNQSGTDGKSGSDGTSGGDGASGTDGLSGGDGSAGLQGEKGDPGQPLRTDCAWCAAGGGNSCSPDGVTLQECVDDGDGCGHWEAVKVCGVACSLAYREQGSPDALGNLGNVESRCFEANECSLWRPCASGSCVDGTCESAPAVDDCSESVPAVCSSGQECTTLGCVSSDEWFVATATLTTAFDGKTHQFTAIGDYLYSLRCSASLSGTYWNSATSHCANLLVGPRDWSESSLGAAYAGDVLYPYGSVSLMGFTGTGTQAIPCSSLMNLAASRFSETNKVCSVTLTEFNPAPGGIIQGTFTASADVKGHEEATYASSLTMSGAFRMLAK